MNISALLRPALTVALLLLLSHSHHAQDSKVYVVDVKTTPDEVVDVEIRGVALTSAVGVQLSVSWDSTLMEFVGVSDVVDGGSLEKNFNRTRTENGQIGYFFYDESLSGLSLVDSGLIFKLQLRPLVTNGAVANIDFVDTPIGTVMTNAQLDSLPVSFFPGSVTIDMTSAGRNAFANDHRLTVAPNPFTERCQIDFSPGYAGEASLEILDAAGRTVLQRPERFGFGNNRITLTADDLPAAGTYIIRLVTDREQLHRKLILGRGGL